MRIDRWFKLHFSFNGQNWSDIFKKSLAHELPNGLQFYSIPGEGSYFLVDKDMVILCKIYTENCSNICIEEM